jgi:hypothetical protein
MRTSKIWLPHPRLTAAGVYPAMESLFRDENISPETNMGNTPFFDAVPYGALAASSYTCRFADLIRDFELCVNLCLN